MRESSLPRVFRSLGHDEAERAASTTGGALLAVRLLFFVAYADLGTPAAHLTYRTVRGMAQNRLERCCYEEFEDECVRHLRRGTFSR
jgi:hypothetical protein